MRGPQCVHELYWSLHTTPCHRERSSQQSCTQKRHNRFDQVVRFGNVRVKKCKQAVQASSASKQCSASKQAVQASKCKQASASKQTSKQASSASEQVQASKQASSASSAKTEICDLRGLLKHCFAFHHANETSSPSNEVLLLELHHRARRKARPGRHL